MSETTQTIVTAAVVVIGNEILSGRTQDINIAYLAKGLTEIGIRLKEVRIVADEEDAIVAAVNACRTAYTYVFTTGGIGPTHDDITAPSVAKAFGLPLALDPEARRRLEKHYKNPSDLNDMRLRMAHVPQGARLIDNPISQAPGFAIGNVHVLAGVPRIMQAMFDGIRHDLKGGAPMLSRSVGAYLPEGIMADPLARVQERFPEVEIGSYPFFRQGRLGSSLVARGVDANILGKAVDALCDLVKGLGGEPMVDADQPSLGPFLSASGQEK